MKSKRILLLNTSFKQEGPNDVLWQLAKHVDRSKYELVFACMSKGGAMERMYSEAGYETHNFKMDRFIDLGAVLRVRDYVKSEGFELVSAQLLRAEVFGGLGTRLAGVPLIFVTHNIDPYRAKRAHFPHYQLSRMSMRWPIRFVAVSDYVKQYIVRHQNVDENTVSVIPNAIDSEAFTRWRGENDAVREELSLGAEEVIIGNVARFTEQKGLFFLLESFKLLCERHDNLRLVLVGDGPLRKKLEMWAKDNKLQNKIMFTGFRHDFARIMECFDILSMSSLWEGMPMVLLGAMTLGKAVVATNVSGIPEVVNDGVNGLLVEPGDAVGLAERTDELIQEPGLRTRLGARAAQSIADKHSPEDLARRYEKLWSECLRGSN